MYHHHQKNRHGFQWHYHQLRLDFETMSGFVTATKGTCTDYLTAKGSFHLPNIANKCYRKYEKAEDPPSGKTGKTLPSICGTNTDYHSKHWNFDDMNLITDNFKNDDYSNDICRPTVFLFWGHNDVLPSVYVEFGATSTDTVTVTNTLGSTTSTLKWNILTQQIPCTATYRFLSWG